MQLLAILKALQGQVEELRIQANENPDEDYSVLSARFTEIAALKPSHENHVPGISLNDIKRKVKASSNTYYSIYSGLLDKEITRSNYLRQLGIIAVQVSEVVDELQSKYNEHLQISGLQAQVTKEPVKAVEVTAAVEPQKIFRDLREIQENLGTAESKIDDASKDVSNSEDFEYYRLQKLREKQGAPATPEGYRALNEKNTNKVDHDPSEAIKQQMHKDNEIRQDEHQLQIVQQYQEALNKLKQVSTLPNADWAISKGPIFFSSMPPVREFQIKNLKCEYSQFFPGWILADQWLIGIKPSLINKKEELWDTLKHIQSALSQRFPSKFIYMTVPDIKLSNVTPAEKVRTRSNKVDEKGNTVALPQEKVNKNLQKLANKDSLKAELPKFSPLPGSKLLWTWIMMSSKYNTLPMIKIKSFGFPIASNLRKADERLAKKIVPEIKNNPIQIDDLAAKYRKIIDEEFDKQWKPIEKKIADAKDKVAAEKLAMADLQRHIGECLHSLEEQKHDLTLAATSSLRDKINKNIHSIEDRLAVLQGTLGGHKKIAKSLEQECTSLNAQKGALLSQIRQEATESMKKARQGIPPDDKYKL